MYTLLSDRLAKANRRHVRPALIARHLYIALECMVGIALVVGGNIVVWYWLVKYIVMGSK